MYCNLFSVNVPHEARVTYLFWVRDQHSVYATFGTQNRGFCVHDFGTQNPRVFVYVHKIPGFPCTYTEKLPLCSQIQYTESWAFRVRTQKHGFRARETCTQNHGEAAHVHRMFGEFCVQRGCPSKCWTRAQNKCDVRGACGRLLQTTYQYTEFLAEVTVTCHPKLRSPQGEPKLNPRRPLNMTPEYSPYLILHGGARSATLPSTIGHRSSTWDLISHVHLIFIIITTIIIRTSARRVHSNTSYAYFGYLW